MNTKTQTPGEPALSMGRKKDYVRVREPTAESGSTTFETIGDMEQSSHKVNKPYRTQNFDPQLEFSPVSYRRSLINFIKAILGAADMTMPYVMQEIGLSAPLVMIFVAFCVHQSMVLMLDSFHKDGDRSQKHLRFYYWHTSTACFGKWGTYLSATQIRATSIMFVGLGLVISSETLNDSWEIGTSAWTMIMCGITIFEVVILPDLRELSWASSIGILNHVVCCVVLVILSLTQIQNNPSLLNSFISYTIFDLEGFFLGSNKILVAFYSTLALPSIYMEMQEKDRANSMLFWGHLITLLGRLVMMISVFYVYQGSTEGIAILSIENFTLRTFLSVCLVVDRMVTIPMWLYPNRCELHTYLRNKVEPDVWNKWVCSRCIAWIIPTIEVIILLIPSVILALLVPNFLTYLAVFGCVIVTPQTLTLPVIQWWILTKRKPIWKELLAFGIGLFGAVIAIGGLYFL